MQTDKKNQIVFSLIKASLFNFETTYDVDDWKPICDELQLQAIDGIVAPIMQEVCDFNFYRRVEKIHMAKFLRVLDAQDTLLKKLFEANIQTVILKGSAVSCYYPRPELRTMGDVDFLVRPEQFDYALQLLENNGYELVEPIDAVDYHVTLKKNNIIFELHKSPSGLPDGKSGKFILEYLFQGMNEIENVTLFGYDFPVLPWLQNGLVLLLHIKSHINDGLGMRQIIDWMEYVQNKLTDESYEEFQSVLRKCGLEKLAINVTKMCQVYLGLDNSIKWCNGANVSLCENLINYIMQQGNFGIKTQVNEHATKSLSRKRSILQILKDLQYNGLKNSNLIKKHPWLKSFAWLSELLRYVKFILNREKPMKTLYEDIQLSRKRKRMFKQLF